MKFRFWRSLLAALVLLAVTVPTSRLHAQGLTGQISGVVTDSGGGVMPGATVTVKNVGTNATRDTVTGADGAFLFPDLLAGTYDLTVSIEGFKSYEQKGLVLGATERLALRAIASRGRCADRAGHGAGRGDAGADQQRGALGPRRPGEDRRHLPQGARLRRLPQAAARASSTPATARRRAGAAWAA